MSSSNEQTDNNESDESNNATAIISEISNFVTANSINIANGRLSSPKSPDEEIIDKRRLSLSSSSHRKKVDFHEIPFILATQKSPCKQSSVDLLYLLLSPTPKKKCRPISITNERIENGFKVRSSLRRRLALSGPYSADRFNSNKLGHERNVPHLNRPAEN